MQKYFYTLSVKEELNYCSYLAEALPTDTGPWLHHLLHDRI